jgi:putative NADH-flavin reductase
MIFDEFLKKCTKSEAVWTVPLKKFQYENPLKITYISTGKFFMPRKCINRFPVYKNPYTADFPAKI